MQVRPGQRRRNEASALFQPNGFLPALSPLVISPWSLALGLRVRKSLL